MKKKKCLYCNKSYSPKRHYQKYCSRPCVSNASQKRIKSKCGWCGEDIEVKKSIFKGHNRHYCCHQHLGFSNSVRLGAKTQQVAEELTEISWSHNIAYLIGIITTDGTLHKNRKLIKISSSDKLYLEKLSEIVTDITGRTLYPHHSTKEFNEKVFDHYSIQFTSYPLYEFCIKIGLMPNKTHILTQLDIPDKFFHSFLRGVIDGDGNFNTKKDSEIGRVARIRIYSGSRDILEWINHTCKRLHNIEGGKIFEGKNQLGSKFILSFSKVFDNLLIINEMYKHSSYFYQKRYNQARYTIENIDYLKERYSYTDLFNKEMECSFIKCNRNFTPRNTTHKFCSTKCKQRHYYYNANRSYDGSL